NPVEPFDALAGFRGYEHDRGERKELQSLANLSFVVRGNSMCLRYGIPLIDCNDYGPAGFMGVTGDMGIECGHACYTGDDKNRDVALFQMSACHDHAQFFGFKLCLTLPPNSSSVNKPNG